MSSAAAKERTPGAQLSVAAGAGRESLQNLGHALNAGRAPEQEPVSAAQPAGLARHQLQAFNLLSRSTPDECLAQFRQMRGRLLRLKEADGRKRCDLRSLLVTSAEPGEGKTFIALNLALMLAVSPRCRVLLVDASVDRAQFPMRFDLPSGPGLRDVIAGEPWSAAARKVPDMELYVLTLGLAQPSSLEPLDTRSLKLWLDQVRPEFDWIILDGPALTASPEAEALAFVTDRTLLVLDPGKARASLVSRALGHVDPARLAGVVFNRKPRPDER